MNQGNHAELTWLGTAGFIIKSSKQGSIAFDPYLSRPESAKLSPFKAKDFENIDSVFLGHGHFDHAYDIPEIASVCGCQVYAGENTKNRLMNKHGLEAKRFIHKTDCLNKHFSVRSFKSKHVNFDCALLWTTLKRLNFSQVVDIIKLGINYPQGETTGYTFETAGKKFLFLSSAGFTKEETEIYQKENIDVLLLPLQGHTHISKIAADFALKINPKIIIPHHHDNFYPPISQEIKTDQLKFYLSAGGYKGEVLEIPLFDTIAI